MSEETDLLRRLVQLKEREVHELKRIADRPMPTKRTWSDVWNGVPVGEEHNRAAWNARLTRGTPG